MSGANVLMLDPSFKIQEVAVRATANAKQFNQTSHKNAQHNPDIPLDRRTNKFTRQVS